METKFVTSNQLQIEKPKTEKLQNPFGSDSKKNISFNKKTLKKNRMGYQKNQRVITLII